MRTTNNGLTRKQKMRVQATVLADYSPQSAELNRMNDSIEKLRSVIDGMVDDIKAGKIDTETVNNIYKISNALSGIARARNEIEKTRLETITRHHEAVEHILREFMSALVLRPELYNELEPFILDAAVATDKRYQRPVGGNLAIGSQQQSDDDSSNTPHNPNTR